MAILEVPLLPLLFRLCEVLGGLGVVPFAYFFAAVLLILASGASVAAEVSSNAGVGGRSCRSSRARTTMTTTTRLGDCLLAFFHSSRNGRASTLSLRNQIEHVWKTLVCTAERHQISSKFRRVMLHVSSYSRARGQHAESYGSKPRL